MVYALIAVSIPVIFALHYILITRLLDDEDVLEASRSFNTNTENGPAANPNRFETETENAVEEDEYVVCPECGTRNENVYTYCSKCVTRLM